MKPSQQHLLGVLLILAATAFFAIAGVFTKMASADAWVIAGWRGLIGSMLISAYVFWRRRRQNPRQSLRLDRRGWLLVMVTALASILFIVSLKNTYVANMAAIYATTPFVAAGIAWLWLRERVSWLMLATQSAHFSCLCSASFWRTRSRFRCGILSSAPCSASPSRRQ